MFLINFRILEFFNTTPEEYEVIFTSGATAAIKIISQHFQWYNGSKFLKQISTHNQTNFNCEGNNKVHLNDSENPQSTKLNFGAFVYMQENHTSVLGMREDANNNGASVYSVPSKQLSSFFQNYENQNKTPQSSTKKDTSQNSCDAINEKPCLFAYSAQCNYSGSKYPLKWINFAQNGALNPLLYQKSSNCKEGLVNLEKG